MFHCRFQSKPAGALDLERRLECGPERSAGMPPPHLPNSHSHRQAPLQNCRSAPGCLPRKLSVRHYSYFADPPFPPWRICGRSCRPQWAQLLRGHLAPPGGVRGTPDLRTATAGSCKRRGGCDAGVRQLPTAGAAAALRTGTGEYAAQVRPLPGDVSAAGYKNLARSLPRFS